METNSFESFREYVHTRLDALSPIFAKAAVGDFNSNIDIPDTDDKFTELYVGIQVMLDVIMRQTAELHAFTNDLEGQIELQIKELRSQNHLLETILQSIGDGIVVVDALGRPIMSNPAAKRLVGLDILHETAEAKSEHYGMFHVDTTTPFPDEAMPIIRATKGEKSDNVEMFVRNANIPNGLYMSVTANPLRDEAGKPFGGVAIFRDISVHKQLQEELEKYTKELEEKVTERTKELEQYLDVLHKEEAKERALLESIGDGVIAVDEDMKILYVNQASERLLALPSSEMVGKLFFEVVEPSDESGAPIPYSERHMTIARTSGKSISGKSFYRRRDGKSIPVSVTISPMIYEGSAIGQVNTFRDISKEIAIDLAKDEIVSLVSHQLRTPPTGIKWYTGMLLDGDVGALTEPQRNYVKEIKYNNQRMIDVVNMMLNSSRIELGTFHVLLKPISLIEVTESVLGEFVSQIESKHLQLEKHYDASLPSEVETDPILIRMVLQNLLINSVKYTAPYGRVAIAISLQGSALHIQITDTGCGIPEDDQPKIFSKLFRAGNARSIDPSGSGLGLYIVKHVVEELAGSVRFESTEGKGTTFFVELPIKPLSPTSFM